MGAITLAMLLAAGIATEPAAQANVVCSARAECRELALQAIAAADYERAHDFAWRVVQTSPRRDRDPDALSLLARTQSLSGRGYDAVVMLQRLAGMGVIVDDAVTSDDFRRAREHPQWGEVEAAMSRLRNATAPPKASAPAAAPTPAARAATVAPATPLAPAAPLAPVAPVAPIAPIAPVAPLAPVLPLPASLPLPSAFAYDAVSARFVLARRESDILSVLSETSGNATNLVSAGWSGGAEITAVAIDRRRGDLWVAGNIAQRGVIYHVQLISGRLLQTLHAPVDAGESQFVAMALGDGAVFVLDAVGRRIFSLAEKSAALRVAATLPKDITPYGVAFSGSSFFVSHASGLLRVDVASRAHHTIAATPQEALSALYSLAWAKGSLVAIRRENDAQLVRVRFDGRVSRAVAVDVLGTVATPAATVANDHYYYIAATENGLGVGTIPLTK